MNIGDTVLYVDADKKEQDAIIECIVPPAIDPLATPKKCGLDRDKFNTGLIGGGVRDEVSYLISIPGKGYRNIYPAQDRQLLWPKLERIKEKPKPAVKAKVSTSRYSRRK